MDANTTSDATRLAARKTKVKWLIVALVAVVTVLSVPSLVLAHNGFHHGSGGGSGSSQTWQPGHHGNGSGATAGTGNDHHGNGSSHHSDRCDYVDADGDGVCDHCGDGGHGHAGWCGGYVDADEDGVCDHCANASVRCSAYQGASGNRVCNVYRLYNGYSGEHHYTLDENECDTLVPAGWNYVFNDYVIL